MATISVIIPTYNSSQGVCDTLDAIIRQQEYDISQLEIIVVDNNSTDDTQARLETYKIRLQNLQVLTEKKQGSYAARNTGISKATGDLLCFIDADVEPEELFFKEVIEEYKKEPFDYAGVNVEMKRTTNTLAADYDAIKAFHVKNTIHRGGYSPTLTLLVNRKALQKVGKFDERLESGGDVVFGKLCRKAGLKQVYLPNIKVVHPTRNTYQALVKKNRRIARGYAFHMKYYPEFFNHEKKYFKTLRFYLPNNPIRFIRVSKERGLNISVFRCLVLTLLQIHLAIHQRSAYYITKQRLKG